MFTNHGTKCLIILALLVGQRERQLCQAWIHQPNTSRVSRLQAKSKAHNLQRRDVLFQSIHVLMGTSLLIPRSSIAYFDYTDEEIELQEEKSNETPPPPPPEPKKKAPSHKRRFPFARDGPVPPVVNDSTTEAPSVTEPAVVTPPVEEEPTDPTKMPLLATSDVQCLTDCMYSCQQEASTNDKIACLDNCPTRCLSESTPQRQQEEPVLVEPEQ